MNWFGDTNAWSIDADEIAEEESSLVTLNDDSGDQNYVSLEDMIDSLNEQTSINTFTESDQNIDDREIEKEDVHTEKLQELVNDTVEASTKGVEEVLDVWQSQQHQKVATKNPKGAQVNKNKVRSSNALDWYQVEDWTILKNKLSNILSRVWIRGSVKTIHFHQQHRQIIRRLGGYLQHVLKEDRFPDIGLSLNDFQKKYFAENKSSILADAKRAITTSHKMREQETIKWERLAIVLRLITAKDEIAHNTHNK